MSIRKRTWKTSKGESKEAWIVDYLDQGGKRRLKTFGARRTPTPGGKRPATRSSKASIRPIARASPSRRPRNFGLKFCSDLERATVVAYKQHVDLHIVPLIGGTKLSQLSAPMVRSFEDRLRGDRSVAMVKKIRSSLGSLVSDAQERGLVARNVVRDLRARRKKGKEKQAASRQKGRLKIGVDIPSREEIRAIVASLQGRWRPILLNGDLYWPAGLSTSRTALGGRRSRQGRASRPAKGRPVQRDWRAEIGLRRAHGSVLLACRQYAKGMEACLPSRRVGLPDPRWGQSTPTAAL